MYNLEQENQDQYIYGAPKFADYMGVSLRTIMNWLDKGYIPNAELIQLGDVKVWRFPKDALQMSTPVQGSKYLMHVTA